MGEFAADLGGRGDRRGGAPQWRWRPLAALAEALAAEGDRRILWLPVFFGAGIALYFTPTVEPPRWPIRGATVWAPLPPISPWPASACANSPAARRDWPTMLVARHAPT